MAAAPMAPAGTWPEPDVTGAAARGAMPHALQPHGERTPHGVPLERRLAYDAECARWRRSRARREPGAGMGTRSNAGPPRRGVWDDELAVEQRRRTPTLAHRLGIRAPIGATATLAATFGVSAREIFGEGGGSHGTLSGAARPMGTSSYQASTATDIKNTMALVGTLREGARGVGAVRSRANAHAQGRARTPREERARREGVADAARRAAEARERHSASTARERQRRRAQRAKKRQEAEKVPEPQALLAANGSLRVPTEPLAQLTTEDSVNDSLSNGVESVLSSEGR